MLFKKKTKEKTKEEIIEISVNHLGHSSKMITYSKSAYKQRNPGNVVIFNSNVCTKKHGKIWFGDIDVTKNKNELINLAKNIKENVYVLNEMDGRFENEKNPKIKNFVVKITPKGSVELNQKLKEIKSWIL